MPAGWQHVLLILGGLLFQACMVGLVLVRPPQRQSSALAWIFLILILPIVGAGLFLLVGDVRMGARRRRKHREILERVRATLARHATELRAAELPDVQRSIANLAYLVGDTVPRAGNRLELLADTEGFVAAVVADLDATADHAHLLYYIFLDDESGRAVGAALLRAAARGVRCRLLVDAAGSKPFLRSRLRRELERGGVRVVAALPRRLRLGGTRIDLRNHRKFAVLDGRVAYTGSHNVAAASFAPKPRFAPWVDATVRIEGPAVRDVQELFVEDWYVDTGETLEECLSIAPPTHEPGI